MKLVSHHVKFIIKVTCLGLYMHHLVFWNKLSSGKSICIFKVFNCLYELEQYITSCNSVRIVDKVSSSASFRWSVQIFSSASFRWSVQIFIFCLLEMIETHPTVKTRLNNSKY